VRTDGNGENLKPNQSAPGNSDEVRATTVGAKKDADVF
jgi:hypothetical protein